MSDVWQYDGQQWSLLTDAAAFDSRAWFVFSVLHVDQSTIPEKMFLFSGGNVGTYVRTHAYIYSLVLPEQNKMSDNVNEDKVELKSWFQQRSNLFSFFVSITILCPGSTLPSENQKLLFLTISVLLHHTIYC